MLWEGILFVLFWAAVIGLAVWAVSAWRPRDEWGRRTALDIAEERYARGDITRDEFDQVRRDLLEREPERLVTPERQRRGAPL